MAEPPVMAGAVQERLIWVLPLAVATRAVGASGTVVTKGAAATWKTPESPYMGWVEAGPTPLSLPMGPWPVTEELGRLTRTFPWVTPSALEEVSKNASVPSWSQPVRG